MPIRLNLTGTQEVRLGHRRGGAPPSFWAILCRCEKGIIYSYSGPLPARMPRAGLPTMPALR